jgi:hypothetical protein
MTTLSDYPDLPTSLIRTAATATDVPATTAPLKSAQKVVRLECSACGAEGQGSCDCGAPYLRPAERAANAIAANPEKSDRAIAAEIGVDHKTVGKVRSATGDNSPVEPRVGRDGKKRKQPKPRKPRKSKQQRAAERIDHFLTASFDALIMAMEEGQLTKHALVEYLAHQEFEYRQLLFRVVKLLVEAVNAADDVTIRELDAAESAEARKAENAASEDVA